MARKGEVKQRIRGGFSTASMNITAAPTVIPEDTLRGMDNVIVDQSGVLQKRPVFKSWGQKLYTPTDIDITTTPAQGVSFLSVRNQPGWTIATESGPGYSVSQDSAGVFKAYAYNSTDTGVASAFVTLPSDQTLTSRKTCTFLMTFKSHSLVNTPAITNGVTISFRSSSSALAARSFQLTSTSLWHANSSNVFTEHALGVTLDDALPHTLQITIDSDEEAVVSIDGEEVATFDWSDYNVIMPVTDVFGIYSGNTTSGASDFSTIDISNVVVRDTDVDAFTYDTVEDVSSFDYLVENTFDVRRRLVALTSGGVWIDYDYRRMWNRIARLPYSKGSFFPFRGEMFLISKEDKDRTTYMFKITDFSVTQIDSAPNCRFAVDHDNRVFCAGDYQNPQRLYFSGDRSANIWMDDDPLDAGFIDIPLVDGERITALRPFLGELLVYTDSETYRISGSGGAAEYERRLFKDGVGALNNNCTPPVGNDVWACGEQGISSVTTSDQYGDLLYVKTSLPIQTLFANIGQNLQSMPRDTSRIMLTYHPVKGLVYFSFSSDEVDGISDSIYCASADGSRWMGKWNIQHTSANICGIGYPYEKTLMLGTSTGQILYDAFYEDADVQSKISSVHINGRSIDPNIVAMKKGWASLRLLYCQRGKWDATLRWRVDNDAWKERDITLLPKETMYIDGATWEVTEDMVVSKDTTYVAEIPLDCRGRELAFEIIFDEAKLALTGWELDFTIHGNEVD